MKYFKRREIESAIEALVKVHPFFRITFLVAKLERLPVGDTKPLRLDAATASFLTEHFRLHPKSKHFFLPYHQRYWVNPDYPSSGLQTINTQTFKDVFIHELNSREWGWKTNYVLLLSSHLKKRKIPIWPLAVWLYKSLPFDESNTAHSIYKRFADEMQFTREEIEELFVVNIPESIDQTFQDTPVEWHEIISSYPIPRDVGPDVGGILSYLETQQIGPVENLIFKPGPRLNLITGDNSLGKTFLLDVVWWALTQTWIGDEMIPYPSPDGKYKQANIKFQLAASTRHRPQESTFCLKTFTWPRQQTQAILPGLVVYARADGSYAIWDPARLDRPNQEPTIHLTREGVWRGQTDLIEGVIRDWVTWRTTPNSPFQLFVNALARVSPPEFGKLSPGRSIRLPFIPQELPTITHSYGDVAIIHESAGVKRMISLAYLIVWVWHQHRLNAELLGRPSARQLVVLIDELEAHLHPKWQRVILPALLGVFNDLSSELDSQVFVASHSPLVLASSEPVFRPEIDKLHALETTPTGQVIFEEIPFIPHGRADEWLRSRAFGMSEPRSRPAAEAIRRAKQLQESTDVSAQEVQQVHGALAESVPAGDAFWIRWLLFAKKHGVRI